MEWLGPHTILHDGHILDIGEIHDGWEAVNAIDRYENEKKRKFDEAVDKRVKEYLKKNKIK